MSGNPLRPTRKICLRPAGRVDSFEGRMDHGKDVLATYRQGEAGGIAWFVILDAKGKALATSDGPKGNMGYPGEPHEIEHFLAMLKQASRKMEPGQLDRVEAAAQGEGGTRA
jgi:hypothetical protein